MSHVNGAASHPGTGRRNATGTSLDAEMSLRIDLVRLLCVCAIVFIHIPPAPAGTPLEPLFRFLSDGIFRVSVPVLTTISGYMFFRSWGRRDPGTTLWRKAQSLILPLLIWNLPLVLALFALQWHGMATGFRLELHPFEPRSWLDATFGLTAYPLNFPLHFLRDLFAVSLIGTAAGAIFVRAPWLILAIAFVNVILDLEGMMVLRNSMIFNFFLGGLVALRGWDLRSLDRFAPPFAALLVAASIVIAFGFRDTIEMFRLVAPVLVWPLSCLITRGRAAMLAPLAGTSFVIFLIHGPLIVAIWSIAGGPGPSGYPVIFLLLPPLIIALAFGLHGLARRLSPRAAAIAFGGR